MEFCRLQEEAEKKEQPVKNTMDEIQELTQAQIKSALANLTKDPSNPRLTMQQVEAVLHAWAVDNRYGSGTPVHGILRRVNSVVIYIQGSSLGVAGASIFWEPSSEYDKRVYDFAQECYATGNKFVVGGNPCSEIDMQGMSVKSSWVWPNEFVPKSASPPDNDDIFTFGLGKVTAIMSDPKVQL